MLDQDSFMTANPTETRSNPQVEESLAQISSSGARRADICLSQPPSLEDNENCHQTTTMRIGLFHGESCLEGVSIEFVIPRGQNVHYWIVEDSPDAFCVDVKKFCGRFVVRRFNDSDPNKAYKPPPMPKDKKSKQRKAPPLQRAPKRGLLVARKEVVRPRYVYNKEEDHHSVGTASESELVLVTDEPPPATAKECMSDAKKQRVSTTTASGPAKSKYGSTSKKAKGSSSTERAQRKSGGDARQTKESQAAGTLSDNSRKRKRTPDTEDSSTKKTKTKVDEQGRRLKRQKQRQTEDSSKPPWWRVQQGNQSAKQSARAGTNGSSTIRHVLFTRPFAVVPPPTAGKKPTKPKEKQSAAAPSKQVSKQPRQDDQPAARKSEPAKEAAPASARRPSAVPVTADPAKPAKQPNAEPIAKPAGQPQNKAAAKRSEGKSPRPPAAETPTKQPKDAAQPSATQKPLPKSSAPPSSAVAKLDASTPAKSTCTTPKSPPPPSRSGTRVSARIANRKAAKETKAELTKPVTEPAKQEEVPSGGAETKKTRAAGQSSHSLPQPTHTQELRSEETTRANDTGESETKAVVIQNAAWKRYKPLSTSAASKHEASSSEQGVAAEPELVQRKQAAAATAAALPKPVSSPKSQAKMRPAETGTAASRPESASTPAAPRLPLPLQGDLLQQQRLPSKPTAVDAAKSKDNTDAGAPLLQNPMSSRKKLPSAAATSYAKQGAVLQQGRCQPSSGAITKLSQLQGAAAEPSQGVTRAVNAATQHEPRLLPTNVNLPQPSSSKQPYKPLQQGPPRSRPKPVILEKPQEIQNPTSAQQRHLTGASPSEKNDNRPQGIGFPKATSAQARGSGLPLRNSASAPLPQTIRATGWNQSLQALPCPEVWRPPPSNIQQLPKTIVAPRIPFQVPPSERKPLQAAAPLAKPMVELASAKRQQAAQARPYSNPQFPAVPRMQLPRTTVPTRQMPAAVAPSTCSVGPNGMFTFPLSSNVSKTRQPASLARDSLSRSVVLQPPARNNPMRSAQTARPQSQLAEIEQLRGSGSASKQLIEREIQFAAVQCAVKPAMPAVLLQSVRQSLSLSTQLQLPALSVPFQPSVANRQQQQQRRVDSSALSAVAAARLATRTTPKPQCFVPLIPPRTPAPPPPPGPNRRYAAARICRLSTCGTVAQQESIFCQRHLEQSRSLLVAARRPPRRQASDNRDSHPQQQP